jgi:enoyl-CoA hydratase
MELVRYEVDETRVARVVLNRPEKLNAMTPEMMDGLEAAMARARHDDAVHVVVLCAEGAAFCAGYDRKGYDHPDPVARRRTIEANRLHMQGTIDFWLRNIWDFPKPVIARVQGYCYDAGVIMGSLADVTIVADDAKIGPYPTPGPLGAGYFAPEFTMLVGPKRAKEIFYVLGAVISGVEAVRIGWANRSYPSAELADRTAEFAALVARTPVELLTLQKMTINRTAEQTGFRQAMYTGADMDTFAHFSRPVVAYEKSIQEHGFKEAMRLWEGQFGPPDQP